MTPDVKDTEIIFSNHIVIWHVSVWQEIIGEFHEIFTIDSLCRIQFMDGINTYVSFPDKNIIKRLHNSQGKLIGICRTDVPTRRYLFNFYENATNKHTTSIHHKSYEEIESLKMLYGWRNKHVLTKKTSAYNHRNQLQLYNWMGSE